LIAILHFSQKDQAIAFVAENGWTLGVDGESIIFPETEDRGKLVVDKAFAVTVSALQ
jgi:hypothetical protein